METAWMKWILVIKLLTAIMIRSAFGENIVSGIFECYACSSLDTVGCGGDFDSTAVATVVCSGYCYKTSYGYLGERVIDRGCEPSNDCPSKCFGNDCPHCCQGSLCNRGTTMTSFSLLMSAVVGFATLKNIWTVTEN